MRLIIQSSMISDYTILVWVKSFDPLVPMLSLQLECKYKIIQYPTLVAIRKVSRELMALLRFCRYQPTSFMAPEQSERPHLILQYIIIKENRSQSFKKIMRERATAIEQASNRQRSTYFEVQQKTEK